MQEVFYAKTQKHERVSKYKGCEFCPISTLFGRKRGFLLFKTLPVDIICALCSEDIGRHPQVLGMNFHLI